MTLFCRALAAALILPGLPWVTAARGLAPASPRQPDSEADLRARIAREANAVKKAKYEIRLARVELLQAVDAYNKGNLEQGQRLLTAYLEEIRESWQTLGASGRRPVKQPQGFKDLDIELREDARLLNDVAHRVSYTDRDPIEKAGLEVERIRGEVLHALFPAEHPDERGKGRASRRQSAFRNLPA